MTEADVFSLIGDLASGQVYPYVAPLSPEGMPAISAPWIIFTIVSEVFGDTLCGPAEENDAVQIDVYATSIDEARAIRKLAQEALSPLQFTQLNRSNSYEPDTGLYRATMEIQSQQ